MITFSTLLEATEHFQNSPYPAYIPVKLIINEKQYDISNIETNELNVSIFYKHINEHIIVQYERNEDLQFINILEDLPPIISENDATVDVGFECDTIIHGFNNDQAIHSKIDTGADMCSLHGTNISIINNSVQFDFNGKHYNIGLAGQQQVKQAGSDPISRPIIKLNLTIQDQTLRNVECNISDRTDMIPLLIGKNVLTQHNFIIHTQTNNEDLNNV